MGFTICFLISLQIITYGCNLIFFSRSLARPEGQLGQGRLREAGWNAQREPPPEGADRHRRLERGLRALFGSGGQPGTPASVREERAGVCQVRLVSWKNLN